MPSASCGVNPAGLPGGSFGYSLQAETHSYFFFDGFAGEECSEKPAGQAVGI